MKIGRTPRRYLVTGCGDGGLIEVLRIRIRRFEHEELHSALFATLGIPRLADRLRSIENEAWKRPEEERSQFLRFEYHLLLKSLHAPPIGPARLRNDTAVALNGPGESPLHLTSSILNRLALFAIQQMDDNGFEYLPGEITSKHIAVRPDGAYEITMPQSSIGPWKREFEQIVVRHGATPALDDCFPLGTAALRCRVNAKLRTGPDLTRFQQYPSNYFGQVEEAWRIPLFEKPAAGDVAANNLPDQWFTFIGRETEMSTIAKLLDQTRVVTLRGAGGSGKTALAIRVARKLLLFFPDGVWYLSLGALPPTDHSVAQALAGPIGVQESRGGSLAEAAVENLKNKKTLLLLDNCEHLLQPCSDLALKLVSVCGEGLRILATSRFPLRLPEGMQRVVVVSKMAVPERYNGGNRQAYFAYARNFDAMKLFEDRAAGADSNFRLNADNAAMVADLCRSLHGNAYSIKVVAARLAGTTLKNIVDSLAEEFLRSRDASIEVLDHQRTPELMTEWSYKLLDPAEQHLLRRLYIFEDGWDISAAETVCQEPVASRGEFHELHRQLVVKSLIEQGTAQSGRFWLLSLTRDYCRKRLAAPERDDLARRHRDYFLELAEKLDTNRGKEGETLDRLERDYENLRAALEWGSSEAGDAEKRVRLAAALGWYWENRGYLSEGRRRLEAADRQAREADPFLRARALLTAGSLAYRQGDFKAARDALLEALRLWPQDRPLERARTLTKLGAVARETGQYKLGLSWHLQSLKIIRRPRNRAGKTSPLEVMAAVAQAISAAYNGLGVVRSDRNCFRSAQVLFRTAIKCAENLNNDHYLAAPYNNLGIIFRNIDRPEEARSYHEKSLALLEQLRNPGHIALAHYNLGIVYSKENPAKARTHFSQSLDIGRSLGDKRTIALALEGFGRVLVSENNAARAVQLFSVANSLRNEIDCPVEPNEKVGYQRALQLAVIALGQEAYESARLDGELMSRDEAIRLATDEV